MTRDNSFAPSWKDDGFDWIQASRHFESSLCHVVSQSITHTHVLIRPSDAGKYPPINMGVDLYAPYFQSLVFLSKTRLSDTPQDASSS
jgi:hypothetical protein